MSLNHTYQYGVKGEPHRFWFTPDQVARCCLEHGRAKDAPRVVQSTSEGVVVTIKLPEPLIERSCRKDIGRFHGGCREGSTEKYIHGTDGSLTIEIFEPTD